ncbi:VOC family protein [Glutamicibacter endophyticus]
MTSKLTEVAIDCMEPQKLADFWCQVLGYVVVDASDDVISIGPSEGREPRDLAGPAACLLTFARVAESKVVKNRLHLDVNPVGCTQDEEVRRLQALGARRVDVGQGQVPWVVLGDPEGNEFCVLASPGR